jgi:hypothetical protein
LITTAWKKLLAENVDVIPNFKELYVVLTILVRIKGTRNKGMKESRAFKKSTYLKEGRLIEIFEKEKGKHLHIKWTKE